MHFGAVGEAGRPRTVNKPQTPDRYTNPGLRELTLAPAGLRRASSRPTLADARSRSPMFRTPAQTKQHKQERTRVCRCALHQPEDYLPYVCTDLMHPPSLACPPRVVSHTRACVIVRLYVLPGQSLCAGARGRACTCPAHAWWRAGHARAWLAVHIHTYVRTLGH